jgi:hypothetical protein
VLIPKAHLDVYHRLGHGSQPFWRGAGTTISLPGAVRRRRGLLWRASKKFERKGVMGVRAATERFAGRIEPLGPCHRPDARRGNGARREGPERARPQEARACRRAASLGAAFHRLWAAGRGACRGENAQRGGAMERGRKGARMDSVHFTHPPRASPAPAASPSRSSTARRRPVYRARAGCAPDSHSRH